MSEAASDAIALEGYDPVYGARPLKRVLQQRIENPLATELLKGNFPVGSIVTVDVTDGEFVIDCAAQRTPEAAVEARD
jgi:ATP-dependent Clp protease ATP-binding subunit ClpB